MEERKIAEAQIESFCQYLIREEKSTATVEKYLRDVRAFSAFIGEKTICKEAVMAYKRYLQFKKYAVRSINSMLASLNSLLNFLGWSDCRVKALKQQKQVYCAEEKELSRAEYMRLLQAAQSKPRLQLVMQTICGTGIRVSELRFITAEAVHKGRAAIRCKGKCREILLPHELCKRLERWCARHRVYTGPVFLGRSGQPLDRVTVWKMLKALCKPAGVARDKVFPHNLRHLFARTFYEIEKNLSKLADLLGHSSVETTRIYIMESGAEHQKLLERMHLLL